VNRAVTRYVFLARSLKAHQDCHFHFVYRRLYSAGPQQQPPRAVAI